MMRLHFTKAFGDPGLPPRGHPNGDVIGRQAEQQPTTPPSPQGPRWWPPTHPGPECPRSRRPDGPISLGPLLGTGALVLPSQGPLAQRKLAQLTAVLSRRHLRVLRLPSVQRKQGRWRPECSSSPCCLRPVGPPFCRSRASLPQFPCSTR